mmetsp:Transcript_22013/g.61282  ORF Transcript_22013/g.61282 Transcript_22013/m.61282 type:complete len:93 (-) Transcript_22013:126-404(-)
MQCNITHPRASSVCKCLSFPTNGILLGMKDWRGSFLGMVCANTISVLFLARSATVDLKRLWRVWTLYYATQAMFGMWRVFTAESVAADQAQI